MGFEQEYLGNPYLVARELALGGRKKIKEDEYYLSYGSAFDLHQMITQPQLSVYISTPKMMRSQMIQKELSFDLYVVNQIIFGITEIWLDKNEKIRMSDLERTLIDGLKTGLLWRVE